MEKHFITLDSPRAVIDELTYQNYRYNRLWAPHITPKEWALIYQNAETMEERFQREANPS